MEGLPVQNRREFIRLLLAGAVSVLGMNVPFAAKRKKTPLKKLTILYTNDQHSRIDPFPENDPKYPGMGGFSKRAHAIKKIRSEEENVLLLDAGDIFQGTPYFNFYSGELEYKLMSQMGYDAVTLGNHDFDLGTGNIVKQMPHASFKFINCNYDFTRTPLEGKVIPYSIFNKSGLRIGITGVGIELEGLVDPRLTEGIKYNNPIEIANKISYDLKHKFNCDYVICLSHLGYKYENEKVSDIVLAKQSKNIDLIIGGHTHTFLNEPVKCANSEGKEVLITQVGWAGIWLGKIELYFSESRKKIFHKAAKQNI